MRKLLHIWRKIVPALVTVSKIEKSYSFSNNNLVLLRYAKNYLGVLKRLILGSPCQLLFISGFCWSREFGIFSKINWLTCFPNVCCLTETKIVIKAYQKCLWEPIGTQTTNKRRARSAGKCELISHQLFKFIIWLVERAVVWVFWTKRC